MRRHGKRGKLEPGCGLMDRVAICDAKGLLGSIPRGCVACLSLSEKGLSSLPHDLTEAGPDPLTGQPSGSTVLLQNQTGPAARAQLPRRTP